MTGFRAVAAAAAATLALIPAASFAQPVRGYYAATPATAPEKASLVTRSTVWKCGDGVCTAAKANARDNIVCELVAREVGTLTAFRANGADFDTDALAKCNTKAR
ncbi:CC_3452 family protein [Sphingomonas sp. MMS12-HWE2-04]|uniref:CC_3452 family protein n=1 Tax=Sphingomonas sp. MMS12-HWE2-04 TaxID=3234199 RepID=UPI00384E20A5